MFLQYGNYYNENLKAEISLDDIQNRVLAANMIYDSETSKIGVIVNFLTKWEVPEIITVWFDPESDYVICQYSKYAPTMFEDSKYARGIGDLDGWVRPNERRTGKVRETYNRLFDRLEKYLKAVTA